MVNIVTIHTLNFFTVACLAVGKQFFTFLSHAIYSTNSIFGNFYIKHILDSVTQGR
jgi:hypothetical protein